MMFKFTMSNYKTVNIYNSLFCAVTRFLRRVDFRGISEWTPSFVVKPTKLKK